MAAVVVAALLTGPAQGAYFGSHYGMASRVDYYDFVTLRTEDLRADAADGFVVLNLLGKTWELQLGLAPWDTTLDAVRLPIGNEAPTAIPTTYERAFYVGRVVGDMDSSATLGLTGTGAFGTISTVDGDIAFEPVHHSDPTAPTDLVVVYPTSRVRFSQIGGDVHLGGTGTGGGSPPQTDPSGPPASGIWPDRKVTLWADKEMSTTSGWTDRAWAAFNTVKNAYNTDVGWTYTAVNNQIYFCDNDACQVSWGMTSSDGSTLLTQWPNKVKVWPTVSTYEIAHLFTGKSLNGGAANGVGWQSGRYGATNAVNRVDSAIARTLAHEIGHNFNGDHGRRDGTAQGRANWAEHNHGGGTFNDCHLGFGTICVINHEHTNPNDWWYHYDLMWSGASAPGHEPHVERPLKFHEPNKQWVKDCNQTGHTEGSKDPGNDINFGWFCTH